MPRAERDLGIRERRRGDVRIHGDPNNRFENRTVRRRPKNNLKKGTTSLPSSDTGSEYNAATSAQHLTPSSTAPLSFSRTSLLPCCARRALQQSSTAVAILLTAARYQIRMPAVKLELSSSPDALVTGSLGKKAGGFQHTTKLADEWGEHPPASHLPTLS